MCVGIYLMNVRRESRPSSVAGQLVISWAFVDVSVSPRQGSTLRYTVLTVLALLSDVSDVPTSSVSSLQWQGGGCELTTLALGGHWPMVGGGP